MFCISCSRQFLIGCSGKYCIGRFGKFRIGSSGGSVTSVPGSSVSGVPESSVSSVPEKSLSGVPGSLLSGVPENSVSGVPESSIASIPGYSLSDVPECSVSSEETPNAECRVDDAVNGKVVIDNLWDSDWIYDNREWNALFSRMWQEFTIFTLGNACYILSHCTFLISERTGMPSPVSAVCCDKPHTSGKRLEIHSVQYPLEGHSGISQTKKWDSHSHLQNTVGMPLSKF